MVRVIRDHDTLYMQEFDQTSRRRRVKARVRSYRAPNMNAYVERFVQSIKQECLDHFFIFGTRHLDLLCREYLGYYHWERPHQGRENEVLAARRAKMSRSLAPVGPYVKLGDVRCRCRLGGLLKHYERRAA